MHSIVKISEVLKVDRDEAERILEKAVIGGEITEEITPDEWIEKRLLPNCIFINEEGYTKMCIDALKILKTTTATDYGSSRQRDMGQLWADMTRGYLGELAFTIFLQKKCNLKTELGHEKGDLEKYLSLDIHKIKKVDEEWRAPKLKLSVKATKWNGIWLDIPGDQFSHSDIHVLVKVGVGRDHLFAFFKKISVFKDKVLKRGEEVGILTSEESQILYDNIPSFQDIPAYICGFAKKTEKFDVLSYGGKKGRYHYKIKTWNGPINSGDLDLIRDRESLIESGKVEFEGIGKFGHDKGYLFNTGNLCWKDEDWKEVYNSL